MNAQHGTDPIQSAVKHISRIRETQVLLPRCRKQRLLIAQAGSQSVQCMFGEPCGPSGNRTKWEERIRKLSLHGLKLEQCFQLGSQIEFQDLLGLCSPAGLDTVLHPASMRLAGDWEDLEFLGLNWQRSPPRARSGAGCSDE